MCPRTIVHFYSELQDGKGLDFFFIQCVSKILNNVILTLFILTLHSSSSSIIISSPFFLINALLGPDPDPDPGHLYPDPQPCPEFASG